MIRKHILHGGDMDRFLIDCQRAQDCGFAAQEAYANLKRPDAYRMHSGWPFSQHIPFPDRWGFEPNIDYQSGCLQV